MGTMIRSIPVKLDGADSSLSFEAADAATTHTAASTPDVDPG